MTPVVMVSADRAAIFDRETGQVIRCSVPTALENVANGKGRFVHGETGDRVEPKAVEPAPVEPVIPLKEEDVLPLPEPEPEPELTPAQEAALDHDGDGKAGGSTPKAGRSPEEEAERAELFATFKALGVKVFAGSTTEKLREKLAEIESATAPA